MKKNNQEGITLIALIITIIVLLILAIVSIKIAIDGGLTTKAQEATLQHTIGAEKEAITTGYAAYQIDLAKNTKVTTPTIGEAGEARVTSNGEGWNVTFTKTNNEYELKKDGTITLIKQGNGTEILGDWKKNKDGTFTKGDITLKIGDIIKYDEGKNYTWTTDASKGTGGDKNLISKTYTTEDMEWRVLGINTKGEIELISENPTNSNLYLKGEDGYIHGEEQLNEMCNSLYGKGKYAIGARSLNADDINKLTNYDPTTYEGYGEIYTYRFPINGDYMQYKITKKDGTLIKDWTDIKDKYNQTFRMPGETETISKNNRNDVGRNVENTYYYDYDVENEMKQITSDGKKMSEIILYGTKSSTDYKYQWLASHFVYPSSSSVSFCIRNITDDGIGSEGITTKLYRANNEYPGISSKYVRPVVTLKSDIQLSGNSKDGWTIN